MTDTKHCPKVSQWRGKREVTKNDSCRMAKDSTAYMYSTINPRKATHSSDFPVRVKKKKLLG